MISGNCECGDIRFEIDQPVFDFSHCHCSQCRRLHGAAYATFAGVPKSAFRYTSTQENLACYASSSKNDRFFCSRCGSAIAVASKTEPDALYVSMSTINGNPELPAGYHAFVGSKAPWHEITDALPQYEIYPPEDE